jgi:hypothetical protein
MQNAHYHWLTSILKILIEEGLPKLVKIFTVFLFCLGPVQAADLTKLTNAVMNGWRADFQQEMGTIIGRSSCASSVDLSILTNSVMNGWRSDFQRQIGTFIQCSGCSSSVDLTNLTNSVMNKWRADFQLQMGALAQCVGH